MKLKALVGVPRVTKDQWRDLDLLTRWLIATRASVFILTILSVGIAGILAYSLERANFDFPIFLLVLVGLVLAHATNNLLNDFTDWFRGVDQENYFRNRYGTHPMTVMSYNEMLCYILVTGICALSTGIILTYLRGQIVLYLTLSGAFFLLFYTWPLKIMGLGEVSVFVVWGILMIGGGFYTITGVWNWDVCLASVPYSLGTTAVIMGKHIDKIQEDTKKGISTLPVLLGDVKSRHFVFVLFIMQYVTTFYLVYTKFFSWVMMIVLFSMWNLRIAWKIFSKTRPEAPPPGYPDGVWPLYYVAAAFQQNAAFGILFLIGLIVHSCF